MENVLEVALAKLLITSPEDIMTTFVTRENFGCKQLKHSLRIFGTNYEDNLKSDLYFRLFSSIKIFFKFFCGQNEKYRKIFTPLQDELIKLHEAFIDCQGSLDWYEKNSTLACTEANRIIECYHEALIFDVGYKFVYHYIDIFKKIINEALSKPCKFEKLSNENCEGSDEGKYFKAFGVIAFMVLAMLSVVVVIMVVMRKKTLKN